jgi:hypothetical protein
VISGRLLRAVLLAEAAVVVATAALVVGHGLWLLLRARRHTPVRARARAALAAELAAELATDPGEAPASPAPAPLAGIPPRVAARLVAELAPSLRGRQLERLRAIADNLGLVARARRGCASRWWWRRLHAAHLLTAFGADVPEGLLADGDESVRAQAMEWAGDHPTEERAERLIHALGDPSPLCRSTALDALLRFGPAMVEPLARHLGEDDEPPVVRSLLALATWRPNPRYGRAALRLAAEADPGVRAAAARLLGALGGEEGVAALGPLLADRDPAVRASAASSLGRLGHWPSAAAVGLLLRDPAWPVRRAAGEALAAMGAPGAFLLHRYGGDEDPFAADMARQVRDLLALRAAAPDPRPVRGPSGGGGAGR